MSVKWPDYPTFTLEVHKGVDDLFPHWVPAQRPRSRCLHVKSRPKKRGSTIGLTRPELRVLRGMIEGFQMQEFPEGFYPFGPVEQAPNWVQLKLVLTQRRREWLEALFWEMGTGGRFCKNYVDTNYQLMDLHRVWHKLVYSQN